MPEALLDRPPSAAVSAASPSRSRSVDQGLAASPSSASGEAASPWLARLATLLHEIRGLDARGRRGGHHPLTGTPPRAAQPRIGPSHIPFSVDGRRIILIDDVLYTGRTIRAAVDALLDYGRPAPDRALRPRRPRRPGSCPYQPDYVVRTIELEAARRVEVVEGKRRALGGDRAGAADDDGGLARRGRALPPYPRARSRAGRRSPRDRDRALALSATATCSGSRASSQPPIGGAPRRGRVVLRRLPGGPCARCPPSAARPSSTLLRGLDEDEDVVRTRGEAAQRRRHQQSAGRARAS